MNLKSLFSSLLGKLQTLWQINRGSSAVRFARLTVIIFGSIALFGGVAFAQLPTAAISGTIQDSSQAAIPGATITATSEETGLSRTAQSGADGHYILLSLPIGVYDLKVEAASFAPQVQHKLTLTISQQAVINFTMTVGAVQQAVTVEAAAPLVETTSGSLGGLVGEQKVADLPLNGRNFTDLTLMQTGIAANYHPQSTAQVATGLDLTSNGAGEQSNYITLDGANMKQGNGYNGASITGTQLGVEGIREYLVVTNSFKAEYGMVVGSQTVIATKGGTNQFHGTAFEYLRNSALDAREFVDPPKKPAFHRNNFGGSFGGPIRKDKTFFFVTDESIRQTQGVSTSINSPTSLVFNGLIPVGGAGNTTTTPVTINTAVTPYLALYPAATSCVKPGDTLPYCTGGIGNITNTFATPTAEDYVQGRVDQNFSDKDSFFARYTIDNSSQTNETAHFPGFPAHLSGRSQFVTLAETHIFSTSLLNTARFSYSRPNIYFQSPSIASLAFIPGLSYGMGDISITGFNTAMGPTSTDPFQINENLFTFSDDLSWSHGAHTFKFGTLINRYQVLGLNNASTTGTYTFSSLTNFLTGNASQLNIATPGSAEDRTLRWYTLGFYAQDDWRVTPRLTLNLGLRYEINTTVNEVSGKGWSMRNILTDGVPGSTASTYFNLTPQVYQNPSLHNFGPRLGFAWDVFGNQKTSVRGGFAYLYDIATETAGATTVATGQPPYSSLSTDLSGLTFPHTTIPPSAAGKTIRAVDWNLHQPHMLEYNLTVERSLPANMVLAVSYAGTKGINLLQIEDGDPTKPTNFLPNGVPLWNGTEAFTNPNFTALEFRTAGGESWYNSLQASLQKQLTHGVQFQASYTYSHCLDTTQGQVAGEAAGSNTQNEWPGLPLLSKGNCDWDIVHSFIFNTLYNLPDPIASGFGHTALGGWRISSIITLKTGQPFTVTDSGNASRSLNASYSGLIADLPNVVPGCNVYTGNNNQWYNPACFSPQPFVTSTGALCPAVGTAAPGTTYAAGCYGQLGNEGRNQYFGAPFRNVDFSIVKDTPLHWLGEAGSVEFRTEFFNIFNHPDFGIPSRSAYTYLNTTTTVPTTPLPAAGTITTYVQNSRQIQFALKIIF